jgi:hypothetical protein
MRKLLADPGSEGNPMDDDSDIVSLLATEYMDRFDEAERSGTKPALAIAILIHEVGNDPLLADSVIRRGARAAEAKQERLEQLCLLLARFSLARDRGEVRSAAAYLGTSIKRLVTSWGVPWQEPRLSERGGRKR